jgi:hypothetical protein
LVALTITNPPATTVVLVWDYPTNELPGMSFNIYFRTNLSTNATTWAVLTNVAEPFTMISNRPSVRIPVQPGNMFFVATASNQFGESDVSNMATSNVARNVTNMTIGR